MPDPDAGLIASVDVFTTTPNTDVNFWPSLAQRLTPSSERFYQLKEIIGQTLRVCRVGIVESFNPGPPATVVVDLCVNELKYEDENIHRLGGPEVPILPISMKKISEPIKQLKDVLVFMPGAGDWDLTFPIQKGDECLVIFCDSDHDAWRRSGNLNHTPKMSGTHGLSNGIALFGVRSQPRGLADYSQTSTQLRKKDSTVVIDLATDKITVTVQNGDLVVNAGKSVEVNASDVSVKATNSASVEAPTVSIKGDQVTTIEGQQLNIAAETISVTGSGRLNITGAQDISISSQAPINIQSSVGINIDGNGQTVIDGIHFLRHRHAGTSGAGTNYKTSSSDAPNTGKVVEGAPLTATATPVEAEPGEDPPPEE